MLKNNNFIIRHVILSVLVGVLLAMAVWSVSLAAGSGYWPTNTQWTMLTAGGVTITDPEQRGNCNDPSHGSAAPSGPTDISSQAKCKGGGTKYNPGYIDEQFGTGIQPNATPFNTYSASTFYYDANGDSSGCTNISDDYLFFRIRIAETPLQNNSSLGLTNDYWFATLDTDANGAPDFYVRVNGNGDAATERIELIYETTNDFDPTGEPIVATYINPLNTDYARAIPTGDNGIVGDSTQFFLDWQIPVIDFKSDPGNGSQQILCEGNTILLTNYSTSANGNDPFQKDRMTALGTYSDIIITSEPEYEITKTATDVNGGFLLVGDEVEYTITAHNLASNLSNFILTDPIPVGGTYVPGSIKMVLDGTTYSMTDANDSPDNPGCASTNCMADYNITTPGAITAKNDWIYTNGSASPLYDSVIVKFRVTFASLGDKSNQGWGVTRELPDQLLTDDPAVGGTADPTVVTVVTPPPTADLSITKDDGVATIIPGNPVTYTITVTNGGPGNVTGATVADTFPVSLSGITWTCLASVGSSCTANGSGNINDTAVNLLNGGTATYTVNATTDSLATGLLVNTASVTVPGGILDPNLANNSATDTNTYTPLDFGDAPDPTYPTLLVNDGARHFITPGMFLGSGVDQEPDGLPDANATGDDLNNTDDEDGVTFTSVIAQGGTASVNIVASVAGNLDAWMDFNADGDWADAGEQIFTSQALVAGANSLNFAVPAGATVGDTFSRFRFSTAGGLSYTGLAADGEVEDYKLTILAAPDLSTSTKSDDDADDLVYPLQTITYTLTVINTGGVTATGVDIDDTLDTDLENLNVVSMINCGAPVNASISNPAVLDINGATVLVGTNCVITFTANVKANALGDATIPNTAIVWPAAEGGLGAPAVTSDTLTVAKVPDLSTSTKTEDDADNSVTSPQLNITYTITVKNTGNATGTGISVTDTLDTSLENLNSVIFGAGCQVAPNPAPVDSSTATALNVTGVSVAVGTDCVITFKTDVKAGLLAGTTIQNATIISAASEGGVGANPLSDTLSVGSVIDLSGSSKSQNDPNGTGIIYPGDTITYTILVDNTAGTANATGLTVTDSINTNLGTPYNFSYTGCGSPSSNFTDPVLTFSNVDVNALNVCTITYDVDVDDPITSGNPEAIVINNSASIDPPNGSPVVTAAPLSMDVTPDLSASTKIHDDADGKVIPGQTVKYTITINNTGDGTATGVNVNDTLDTNFGNLVVSSVTSCGTSYVDTSTNEPPVLAINNLRIDPGVPCIIEFTVDVDSPLAGGTTLDNTATVSAATEGGLGDSPVAGTLTVALIPDLSTSTKSVDDLTVDNGQTVTFTTTLINTGNANATGVNITDTLDSNLENLVVTGMTNCGPADSSGSTSTVLNVTGASVSTALNCVITFTADIKAGVPGGTNISNTANISAAAEGGSGGTAILPAPMVVNLNPDLSTSTKNDNDSDNIVEPLQTYTYTITIKNTGNATATGVDIDDTIDVNLENLSVNTINNCGVPTNLSTATALDIQGATIAVGTDCVITFSVRVKAGTPGGTVITNTATISDAVEKAGSGVPALGSTALTVASIPDLGTSTKVDDDADNNVANGQTVTYTITIKNTGNATATGVNIDDVIDTDLENLAVTGMTNCGPAVDNSTPTALDINNASITTALDCVITFTADVTATAPGGSVIPNTATISAPAEGGHAESVASDTLAVNSNINFFASSKMDRDADNVVAPGDTVSYTITLDNSGNANATGVMVTDTINSIFGTPYNFTYSAGCGSPSAGFAAPTLTFTSVDVAAFSTCDINYDVNVANPIINADPESLILNNSANIIPANGSGTLTSDNLSVNVTPNLSTSTVTEDDADNIVNPGQTITYTINIINTGNGTATGVDLDSIMDTNFGSLAVTSINNCGTLYVNGSTAEPPVLDVNNLTINPGTNCIVTYTVTVDTPLADGTTLNNTVTISPAKEGGLGASPSADTLTVLNPVVPAPIAAAAIAGGRPEKAYNATEVLIQKKECLLYNPARQISYTDKLGDWSDYYVDFLSKISIAESNPTQYIISGDGEFRGDHQTTGVGTVRPGDHTNRLEAVKVALTANCIQIYTDDQRLRKDVNPLALRSDFIDLPRAITDDNPNLKYISKDNLNFIADVMYTAYDLGIIDGRMQPDGRSASAWNSEILRAELLKVAVNAADLKNLLDESEIEIEGIPYADVSPDAWYAPYAKFVYKFNIIQLQPDRKAYPERSSSRAEIFALTTRTIYLTASRDHINIYSKNNSLNKQLQRIIDEIFRGTEKGQFLFSAIK